MTLEDVARTARFRTPRVRLFSCCNCGRTAEIRVDGLWHEWRCGCDQDHEIACLPAGGFEVRVPEFCRVTKRTQ